MAQKNSSKKNVTDIESWIYSYEPEEESQSMGFSNLTLQMFEKFAVLLYYQFLL